VTARLITSLRVDHGPAHDQIHVFVLGALTGVLTVDSGKGHALAAEMLGVSVETFRAACRVHDGRSFQVFASELPAPGLGARIGDHVLRAKAALEVFTLERDERLLDALDGELIKAYDACGATS
jgi:hypothetical protein